jgi:hypothetical protein
MCSGIHREFGHKIKGISLSDWTLREVESIEQGGNDRAREIWLATSAKTQISEADRAEPDKIREFIRQKYVEKLWWKQCSEYGENSQKYPAVNGGAKGIGACKDAPVIDAGHSSGALEGRHANPDAKPQSRAGSEAVSLAALVPNVGLPKAVSSVAVAPEAPTAASPMAADSWTADFSSTAPAATAPAAADSTSTDMKWVADFGAETVQPPNVAVNNGTNHGINPGLLGLDFNAAPVKTDHAEDDIAARMAMVLAVAAEAAAAKAPGEELRDSVLSGSGDAVRKLYEESWHNPTTAAQPLTAQYNIGPRPTQFFSIGDEDSPNRGLMQCQSVALEMQAAPGPPSIPVQAEVDISHSRRCTVHSIVFDDDEINDTSGPKEFDDLIHAFQAKNPVLGFDL